MDSGHLRTSPGPTKRRKVDGDNGDGNAQASGSGSSSRTGNNSGHGNGNGNGGDTKKRPVSCDVCRARKVKCVKQEGAERCDGCVSLDQVCSYTHERKKPGPANSFARKTLSPGRDFYASVDPSNRNYSQGSIRSEYGQQTSMPPPPTRWSDHTQLPFGQHQGQGQGQGQGHNHGQAPSQSHSQYPYDFNSHTQHHEPSLELPWLPISPNSLLHPQPGEADSASEGSPMGRWLHNTMAVNEWEQALFGPLPASDPPSASGSSSRLDVAHVTGPTKRSRVEDIIAWSVIMKILHAYHAHLYPLMPIVHWPTFSQQLVAREDEKSDTWRAFLLSLVTYSIIQLPRSALTFLPVKDLRKLHQRCHIESKRLQNRRFSDVSLVDVSTLYCDHIYLGTLGRPHAANIVLAEAIRLAQIINLHDERLGEPIYNVVERETRRRVFWLLYGSDRTITALTTCPLHIHECDLYIPLPLAIDDNLLTSAGAFPQPPHSVPVLAGFHYATRLFRLLGAVLTVHRQLLAPPIDGIHLPLMPPIHRPAGQFLDELERILADLPGPLQLMNPFDGTPKSEAQREKGEAAFGICRANLLVSQAMVRFAIRQYARAVGEEDGVEEKAWAERDVLGLLESMSSESLAANGESLRHKVLFVASSLLEKYPSSAEGHSYVTDFLAVYSRISQEQHASLLDAESAAPSRDPSPGFGGHNHVGGVNID